MADAPRPRRLLVEMVAIVVAVLLALFLNEWRQSVGRAETVAAVLETVRRETETNRAQVRRAAEHHRDLLAQLRSGGVVLARFELDRVRLDTTSEARFALTATDLLRARAREVGRPITAPFRAQRLNDGRWRLTSSETTLLVTIRGDTVVVQGEGEIELRRVFLLDSAWETAQATGAAAHMEPQVLAAMAVARQFQRYTEQTAARILRLLDAGAHGTDAASGLGDLVGLETALLGAYDRLLAVLPSPAPEESPDVDPAGES